MEPNYNSMEAKALLEKVYADFQYQYKDQITLSNFNLEAYQIVFIEQPRSWRIVSKEENHDVEEQTFNLHGIICNSDLPPVRMRINDVMKSKARYLRQSVRVTGLSNNSFEKDVEGIEKIHSLMALHLTKENVKMNPWNHDLYEGHLAVDANARYFTERRHVPREAGLSFNTGVDPMGVLAELRGGDFIHAMDNKVDYLREIKSAMAHGNSNVEQIEPKDFAIGDLVRLTVCFVGYMNKDKCVSMNITLKALTLLESMGKREAKKEMDIPSRIPRMISIKRKRVFDEEHNASRKMERMTIDDNHD